MMQACDSRSCFSEESQVTGCVKITLTCLMVILWAIEIEKKTKKKQNKTLIIIIKNNKLNQTKLLSSIF